MSEPSPPSVMRLSVICPQWATLTPDLLSVRLSQFIYGMQALPLPHQAYMITPGEWSVFVNPDYVEAIRRKGESSEGWVLEYRHELTTQQWGSHILSELAKRIEEASPLPLVGEGPPVDALQVRQARKTMAEGLKAIPDNWDGQGGRAPHPDTIQNAVVLFTFLNHFGAFAIDPTADGLLQAEFFSSHRDHPKTLRVLVGRRDIKVQGIESDGSVGVSYKLQREVL